MRYWRLLQESYVSDGVCLSYVVGYRKSENPPEDDFCDLTLESIYCEEIPSKKAFDFIKREEPVGDIAGDMEDLLEDLV